MRVRSSRSRLGFSSAAILGLAPLLRPVLDDPWVLNPLRLAFGFLLLLTLIGLALMAAGVAITVTIVAAPVGIPIAAFGFLLLVRALF